jgi:hypothetical protein
MTEVLFEQVETITTPSAGLLYDNGNGNDNEVEQVEKPSVGLPWFPIPDRDGWVLIESEEDLARVQGYYRDKAECEGERQKVERAGLVERFEETLRQCQVLPEWAELPGREKTAQLLEGVGFKAKAERWRSCYVEAVPVDCLNPDCDLQAFVRYQCTLRSCPHCGRVHFDRLMHRYCQPIADLIAHQPTQRGRTLAMLTLSVRSTGRMPHPDDAKRLNRIVRRWFKAVVPKDSFWGALFTIEVGHELAVKHPGRSASGWNLHVHGLYYGDFLDWEKSLFLWKQLTTGEGQGFYIKQCLDWRRDFKTAIRRALIHHFGYILKPAGVSPERIAALEVLWTGVRRVHSVGAFYRLPKPPKKDDRCCPKCGHALPVKFTAWKKSERFPVAVLEAEGRRDIDEFPRRQKVQVEIAESLYRRGP